MPDARWMMDTFPNYTEDMWNGNEPNYFDKGTNGDIAHYSCRYGGGSIASDGTILHAQISLDKLNTVYIVCNWIKIMHIPYDGISHYWYWSYGYDGKYGFYEHGKTCLPKYPDEYIEKLLNKKRDFDGTKFYEIVKQKCLEKFNSRNWKYVCIN